MCAVLRDGPRVQRVVVAGGVELRQERGGGRGRRVDQRLELGGCVVRTRGAPLGGGGAEDELVVVLRAVVGVVPVVLGVPAALALRGPLAAAVRIGLRGGVLLVGPPRLGHDLLEELVGPRGHGPGGLVDDVEELGELPPVPSQELALLRVRGSVFHAADRRLAPTGAVREEGDGVGAVGAGAAGHAPRAREGQAVCGLRGVGDGDGMSNDQVQLLAE